MSKKRFLAILLSFTMLLQCMPMNVFAEGVMFLSNEVGSETFYNVKFYRAEVDADGKPVSADGTITYGEEPVTVQLVLDGSKAVMPDIPDVSGYRTIGWSPDPETAITADMEFYAQYSPIDAYNVTVNYVFAASGEMVAPSESYDFIIGNTYDNITVTPSVQPGFSISVKDESGNTISLTDGAFVVDVSALAGDKVYTVSYTGQETEYVVNHYMQKLDGKYPDKPNASEGKTGIAGALTVVTPKAENGYMVVDFNAETDQKVINADGSTVIDIHYNLNTYTLAFNTDGGTYLDTEVLPYTSPVNLANYYVEKVGYTFTGWTVTTTAEGLKSTYDADGSFTMPAADVTLTAGWKEATTATYTIMYYVQGIDTLGGSKNVVGSDGSLSDDEKYYEYLDSYTGTGTVGENPGGFKTNVSDWGDSGLNNTFYTYNSNLSKISQNIEADGSTVYKVYFDRKIVTFTFQERTGGTYWNPTYTTFVYYGLYGQTFTQAGYDGWPGGNWQGEGSGMGLNWTYLDGFNNTRLSGTSVTFTKSDDDDNAVVIQYVEKLNYTSEADRWEPRDTNEHTSGGSFTLSGKFEPGFSYYGFKRNNGQLQTSGSVNSYNKLEIFNTRNSFYLSYANCVTAPGGKNAPEAKYLKFEAPLERPNGTVYPPEGIDSDYVFEGWYREPACVTKVNFTEKDTMPAANMILYAKWVAPEKTVTYHLNYEGAKDPYASYTVKKYEKLSDNSVAENGSYSLPANPTRDKYTFVDWYTDADCTMPLIEGFQDVQIAKNWDIYAKWKADEALTATGSVVTTAQIEIKGYYDENGDWVEITADMLPTAVGNIGETVTIFPISIPGYLPVKHSIQYTIVDGENIVKIEYVKLDTWRIVANYVDTNGATIAESETVAANLNANTKSVEYKVLPDGEENGIRYMWQIQNAVEIVAKENAKNVGTDEEADLVAEVTFVYKKVYEVEYSIQHWVEGTDGVYTLKETTSGLYGWTGFNATASAADAKNYAAENLEYNPNHASNVLKATITADGKTVLKMYYDLQVADYTIYHYLTGTQTPVANPQSGSLPIGDTLTAGVSDALYDNYSSVVFSSYSPSQSIPIDADSTKNVIIVYYAKRAITITAGSAGRDYNGEELVAETYSLSSGTLASGDQIAFVELAGTQKDVGNSPSEASAAVIKNASDVDVTNSYVITYVDGELEVTPATLTITTPNANKTYNGTPLTAVGSITGFVNNETATFTTTGSQTEVGNSPNSYSLAWDGTAKQSNYTISETIGTLTVTEYANEIVVTTTGGTFTYDGQAHGATVSVSELPDGYTLAAAASSATATDVTTEAVPATADTLRIVNAKGEDVTSKLTIKYVDGTITITKRNVTLTSATDSKTYDGTALTNANVTVGGDGWAIGEGATYNVTGTITNAGSTANAFTHTLNEGTKADNYNITKTEGTLTILPVETEVVVTVKGNVVNSEYNGETQSVTGYEIVSISNSLYAKENIQFTGTAAASRKDVGTTNMGISAANFADTSANFTNVRFEVTDGSITITAAPVTVTADNKTKVYGTDDPVLTATVSGLKGTDAESLISYTISREEGEDVGDYVITPSGAEVQGNYNVTYKTGTLTITPVTDEVVVTIVGNKDEKVFNGAEQKVEGYQITNISNTLYAESNVGFKGDDVAARTDIGKTDMGLTANDFTNNSKNFTNVRFDVTDGSMTITPATVTVTADNKSKIYGAQDPELTATVTGLFGDDTVSYDLSREPGEAVGTYTITPAGDREQGNYVVEYKTGTLTITKKSAAKVIITGKNNSVVYNGNEQTFEGYDVSNPDASITVTLVEGSDITARGTEVGKYMMGLTESMFTATSPNFESIEIEVVDGWLDITPITDEVTVTITGKTDSQVYDGTEKTVTGYTFSADNELYLESYVNFTGKAEAKRTVVGKTMMNLTVAQFTNISKNFSNVTFVVNDGWMEITPVTDEVVVTIVGNNDSKMYNGQVQSVEGYEITEISNTLYSSGDVRFTGTAKAERKDFGTTPMGLTESMFDNGNANFSNVKFVVTDGYMTITKRNVTLTSATDDKPYDGTALKNGEITVSGDGFVSGEGATCNVTGSQTEVGSSPNSFTYTLMEGTKADNYNITTVPGTLTVTALTDEVIVTITENSGKFMYDGSEKTVTGYTVTSISNDLYKVSDFSFVGEKDVITGTDAGVYAMNLKPEDFTNTSKNITNVKFVIVDGTLVIEKRAVTLTSATREKVYDSTPLTDSTVSVTGDGWADGEGATYSVTGSQTAKGESPNAFTYTLNANTKAENYNITKVEGTLKVTDLTDKVTVTITENSGTEKYDGTEKTVEGYTVSISNSLYTVNDFVFKGNDTVTGTDAGTYDMLLKPADFENKSANFTNVEFVIKDGTLVIEKRVVTLTSASQEKVYDGDALTNDTVTVTGDGWASGEGATYSVTGTITNVGSTENTFTYTLNEGTKAANYTITTEEGTLTVTPVTEEVVVTITEKSATHTYDGTEKSITGYDTIVASNTLYPVATSVKETPTDAWTAKGTVKGEYPVGIVAGDFENTNENFTNVKFVIDDGILKINPTDAKVTVTITENGAVYTYDGNEKTVSGYKSMVSDNTLYDVNTSVKETETEAWTVKATNEGTYPVGIEENDFENTNPNFTNVEFVVSNDVLQINPIDAEVVVTLKENGATYLYDGKEKTVDGYTLVSISNDLYKEADFSYAATANGSKTVKGTNAGTYEMALLPKNFTNNNTNFANVKFVIEDNQLVITKRAVTMTSATASKTYDGTPLTNSEVKVTGDGFAEGEGATYDVTGSQTLVGSSDNFFTYTLNGGTNADNYEINTVNGTLTINARETKYEVTVESNSGEFDYDGNEHSVSGFKKLTFEVDGNTYTVKGLTASARGIDANTYDVTIIGTPVVLDSMGNNVTSEFTVNTITGKLVINPIDVTVTIVGNNNTTNYDGQAHTVTGYDAEASTDLYKVTGETVDFTFSGNATATRIDAGTTNMGLAADQFVNTNENFATVTFAVTDGYQTINKINAVVTIVGAHDTDVYNGEEHEVTGYTATFSTTLYTEADFTFSGTAEAKRTVEGTTYMGLKAEQFANKNDNFATVAFNVTDGYQTITPIDEVVVTITGHNNTADYDGSEHSVSGYDVSISNPLYKEADFTFSGTAEAKRTDVGTTNMNLAAGQFANTNANFATVTFNVTDGYQTINPINVTVTIVGANNTADYDGEAHTVTGYTATANNSLYNVNGDFTFSGEATATRTDAGTTNMGLAAEQFENTNPNFATVTFNVADGYQKIEPIDVTVTITGHTSTVPYDGTAHTVTGYDAEASTDLYKVTGETVDFTFSGNATATRTDAGTTNMNLASAQFANTNPNFAKVTFVVTDGYQKVDPIDVTVTIIGHNNTTDYDGTAHTVTGYDAEASTDLYKVTGETVDFTFSGNATATRTDAGTTSMGLKAEQFKNTNNNFKTVTFEVTDGYQTINPIDVVVTITGNNNTTVYDGKEHKVTGYEAEADTDLYDVEKDFTFSGKAEAVRTEEGTTLMGLEAEQFKNTNNNFKIVTFEVTDGYQTITPIDEVTVTITENSGSFMYDGSEKTVEGYEVEISNPLYNEGDFTFKGDDVVTGTNVGTYDMKLTSDDFVNNNGNFSKVTFVIEQGTLVITKRTVVMTSADDEKVYDGIALTNETVTVSGDGFADKEGASYDVTGTQTDNGSSDNEFTYTLNEGTLADNYDIEVVFGTLTVTPVTDKVTVTITENSGEFKYDGNEKTVTGYTVTSISNDLYTEANFTFSGDATVAGTDAGTYDMELKPEDFANISKNFTTVEFVIVDGELEITKREVTLTSADDEKVYDGTALTNDTVTVSGDGFAEGEGATCDVTGTITDVGSTANAFTYTLNEGTKADNYVIETVEGTLTVTPVTNKVTVTITEHSGTEMYDGEEKTVTGYDVSISNELYTEADFEFKGNDTVKATNAGTYTMELKPADFTNISINFTDVEFVIVDGTLEITKRAVTMTSATDEKTYDGTALTNSEVTVTGDGFAEGEGATYDVTGSQTEVGESKNTFTYTLKEGTLAANYDITTVEGTLKVTEFDGKVVVTITENKGTEKYDGTEKKVENYTVSINTTLYTEEDFEFNGNAVVTGTNAGTYNMELKPEDFKNISKNFKDEDVSFVIVDGTLEITKREVTLTSADAEKVYDGTALTNSTVTVSGDGFADKEGATYDVTGTQTDNGSSDNEFTYTLNEGTLADNYDIEVVFGTLTVTPVTGKVTVTITENSGEFKYDGNEKTVTGYTVTSISNPLYTEKDFTFSGNATVKGTDAGTYDMELKPEDFANISKNFTTVEFVIVDGELEITKRAVTLTSTDDEKVYDGTALTNDTVTVSGDGFAEGEGATCDVTGTITDVGSTANAFTYTLNEGTKADNYVIETVEGTLTVTPVTDKVTVTITEHSGTEMYDGEEKTVTGYDVSISNELYTEADFEFKGNDTVKATNAGTYNMELKPADFNNISINFTDVEFVIVDGELEITKRAVTMTSATDEKMYDGKALTNDTVTVTGDGFATGEGATYDVTGSQTVIGTSANTFSYKLNDGTLADNYVIEVVYGKLTVTELTDEVVVTITEHSDSFIYDGAEHTVTGYDVNINNPLYKETDFTFSGDATIKGTVAGTYPMELVPENFQNNNVNFSKVTFVIVNGTLEIGKKAITITAGSDDKIYDGAALTNDSYTNDELAEGDKIASVTLTGSQLYVGSSENVASDAKIVDENGDDVTESYDISYVEGTLTVNKKALTITANSDEREYNGQPLTNAGYTATDLAKGDEFATVTVVGSQTTVGSSDNTVTAVVIKDGEVDVTENYEITLVRGTLTITQSTKELKVVANSQTWTYDSEDHADGGYTVTYGDETYTVAAGDSATLSTGDTVTATITKTVKNVADTAEGNNAIVTLVIENEEQYANVVTEAGTLKITERPLTITADSATKLYDGMALTDDGFTADGLAAGDEAAAAKVVGSQTLVGSSDNVASDALVMDGTEDVTANYDIEYVKGTLTVTEPGDHSLVIVKTHAGREYKVGETVEFVITVKNIFADARTITITEIEGVTITGESVFEAVAPGAVVETTAEYVITDEDVINEGFTNTAYATFTGSDKVYKADDEVETVEATSELTITKVVAGKPANGETYALGETIKYEIVVENTANLTVDKIVVADPLTKTNVNVGTLAMGEKSDVIKAEYVVTSDDILNGKVTNIATVTGVAADGTELTDTDMAEIETDDVDSTLSVVKTSDVADGETVSLGDVITYTIEVTNDGNVPFYNVWVVDVWTGDEWMINKLEVGECRILTTTYIVTSDDVLAGNIVNEVTAEADPIEDPKNPDMPKVPEDEDDEEDETDDLDFELKLTKVSDVVEGEMVSLGETITYTIEVTNEGNVPFYNVKVVDEWTKAEWTVEVLAVGETKTFTTSYTVVSDDILKGYVTNVVVAEADPILDPKTETKETPKAEAEVTDETDDIDEMLTVIKTSDVEEGKTVSLGETITYTITVTNEGNVPYYNVKVVDEWTDDEWTIEELAVGESKTFTTTYTVTSDDILNGFILNEVVAEADEIEDPKNPDDPKVPTDDDDEKDETDDVNDALSVIKTSEVPGGDTAGLGEVIEYTIVVKNEGNVPYYNVVVTDEWTNDEWIIDELAVGASETFETEYTVLSDDVLAGKVVNEVIAKADPIADPKNPDQPKTPEAEDSVEDETDDVDYEISVVKTSDVEEGEKVALGETITYTIVVTNEGNVPFHNVVVTDEWTGDVWTIEVLDVDETVTFTTTYVVTSDDILAGKVVNEVTVEADEIEDPKNPDDPKKPEDDDDEEDETDDVDYELEVIKTSDVKEGETVGLGETITYTIAVTNKGNVPFYNVKVVDEWTNDEWTIDVLAVGETKTFTTSYTVVSDDILKGYVTNVVVAEADPILDPKTETKETPKAEAEVTDETDDVDSTLSVVKTSDVADGETVSLGDVITYTIEVTNEGNVPFYNVVVTDEWTNDEWTIEELAVGETETFTTTYTVTSDDILAGKVVNEVTVKGDEIEDPKNPDTPKVPEDDDDEEDETDDVDAELVVTKTSDVAEGEKVSLGDVITYTIVVKNAGNVPFYGVEVIEQLEGAAFVPGAAYAIDGDGNAVITKLAVGAAVTLTAKYTVTSDDILNGFILNEVTAEGDPIDDPKNPDTPKIPEDDDDEEDETDDVNGELSVTKTSEVSGGDTAGLGETIKYTIVVKNEGNVPYYNVVVTDEWTGDEWTIEVLAVGESVTFETSYTVTSDDVLAGKVVNEVTAKADPIDDPKNPEKPVTPEDDDKIEDETDDVNAKISVVKTSDVEEGEKVALGETITYTIVVTNEGNVPFHNVVVTDEWTGDVWTIEVLDVDETVTFTTTYVVTSDDILAGKVVNEVTVEADEIEDPKNPDDPKKPEDDDDEEDETDDVDYELEVIKTSDVKDGETVGLGETITYTIAVTNKGNVPYYNVKVVDEWTNDEWTIDVLAVGETKTFTATYIVKESDLIKGSVLNEVTVKADPIDDPKNPDEPKTPEDEDDIEDPTDATKPSLFIEKKTVSTPANGESYALGETISYEITVLNNGNLTITDIVVTDELTGDIWTIAKLEVGEMSEVLKTSYVVTEADILAGSVLNVATATGKTEDPENPKPTVTPGDIEDPTDEPDPDFDLEKTLINLPEKGYFTVGEKAVYEIVVKNVGNLTLTDIVVTEDLMDAVFVSANDARATVNGATATISELKPGEAVTLTAEYVVKIEDLSTDLRNLISGSGNGPVDPEEDDDNEVTPVDDLVVVAGSKIWDDVDNAYGTRPESITVRLYADNVEIRQAVVTETDGWKFSFDMLPKHNTDGTEIVYFVTEDAIIGYNTEYALDSYDITNSLTEHVLTIRYWYYEIGGEVAAETHESIRKYGEPYDVESPYVIGHSPDAVSIAGIITEDVSYDVIYTRNKYKIVIEYMYLDGTYVWPRITETLYYEDPYEFWTPELEGYTPNYKLIKGNMPHYDLYFKVIYVPDETDIIIEEYGVPLGVGTVEMNVGECFE